MITSSALGIIFANVHDNLISELTERRSMASIPFGGRYRLVDFSLSNLVNAGISKVGIITRENYQSLMDHLGSGKFWDLDRKNGGLFLLPPYITSGARRYNGTVDALHGANDYIKHSKAEYLVLCNADVLANVDVSSAIKSHIANGADIKSVQEFLGHATADFTLNVYAHVTERMQHDTAARVQSYYDNLEKRA